MRLPWSKLATRGPALCEQLAKVEHMSKTEDGAAVGVLFAELDPKLEMLQSEIADYLALPR